MIRFYALVCIFLCSNITLAGGDLRVEGRHAGSVESDGTVRIGGSNVGKFDRDGSIRVKGRNAGILVDLFILMEGMSGKSIAMVRFIRMVLMLVKLKKMELLERMVETSEVQRGLTLSMLRLFSSSVCLIPINLKNYYEQIWYTIHRYYYFVVYLP